MNDSSNSRNHSTVETSTSADVLVSTVEWFLELEESFIRHLLDSNEVGDRNSVATLGEVPNGHVVHRHLSSKSVVRSGRTAASGTTGKRGSVAPDLV